MPHQGARWGEALTSPSNIVIAVQGDIQPHSGTRRGGGKMQENVQCCQLWGGTQELTVSCVYTAWDWGWSAIRRQEAGTNCLQAGAGAGPAVAAAAPSTGPPPDNECKWLPSNIIFTSDWGAAANTRTTLNWQSFRHKVVEICGIDLSIVFFTRT